MKKHARRTLAEEQARLYACHCDICVRLRLIGVYQPVCDACPECRGVGLPSTNADNGP